MEVAANVLVYSATLLAVGGCTLSWWTRGFLKLQLSASDIDHVRRSLARFMVRVAAVLAIGFLARLAAHTAVAFGDLTWDNLEVMALQSRWGQAWRLQLMASLVFLVVALAVRTGRLSGWLATPLAVFVVCATQPLVGHAAGSIGRQALHTSHILGAGIWLGTLAVVLITTGSRRIERTLLANFSPIAVTGVSVLALTGLIAAYNYVGPLEHLLASGYGRTLSGKIALFLVAASLGWTNWRRFSRSDAPDRSDPALSAATPVTLARLETVVALLIVVLTSVLVQLEHH